MSESNRCFAAVVALFLSLVFATPTASAAKFAQDRISIDHARIARTAESSHAPTPPSLVARAAQGRAVGQIPEAPLDGSLVKGSLVKGSLVKGSASLREPVRQVGFLEDHGAHCGPVCDCASCGIEPGCGIEVGCGVEPSCGYEVGCGVEPGCGYEVGCGMETINGCGCDGGCDACCPEVDSIPICLPLLRINWCRFDFFAGVQGFTGPMNYANTGGTTRAGSGSFGFYQGFNEGRSLRRLFGWDMAAQLGMRATQSDLSGASFTSENRNQVFVTGGLFRRVDYGLQYGAVIDYLNDDWYFQGDLLQIRSELSWRTAGCHAFGFQYHAGLNDDSSTTSVRNGTGGFTGGTVDFEPTDQYRLFYRRLLQHSGQWDAFAGWTDNDDALLGASLSLPLRSNLVLSTGGTYLIPTESNNTIGHEEEGWSISLGLIYRPGGPRGCGRYCRPMFDVADNGSFLVDRR
jgi:hypothetical protein